MDVIHEFGCELAELGPCNFLYAVNNRVYAFASRRRYPDDEEREPGLWYLTRQCQETKTGIFTPGIQLQPGLLSINSLSYAPVFQLRKKPGSRF